jgi:hypothetical protein
MLAQYAGRSVGVHQALWDWEWLHPGDTEVMFHNRAKESSVHLPTLHPQGTMPGWTMGCNLLEKLQTSGGFLGCLARWASAARRFCHEQLCLNLLVIVYQTRCNTMDDQSGLRRHVPVVAENIRPGCGREFAVTLIMTDTRFPNLGAAAATIALFYQGTSTRTLTTVCLCRDASKGGMAQCYCGRGDVEHASK